MNLDPEHTARQTRHIMPILVIGSLVCLGFVILALIVYFVWPKSPPPAPSSNGLIQQVVSPTGSK